MKKGLKTLALVAIGYAVRRVIVNHFYHEKTQRKWKTDAITKNGKIYFIGK